MVTKGYQARSNQAKQANQQSEAAKTQEQTSVRSLVKLLQQHMISSMFLKLADGPLWRAASPK